MNELIDIGEDFYREVRGEYGTILADPPWRFRNSTGKVAPEHKRLLRYSTLTLDDIKKIPVNKITAEKSHLYLWVPNALIEEGLEVLKCWGFTYKTNLIWYKIRKDKGPDGRGVGFYFRNVTEMILFGVKGNIRTLAPGRKQVNIIPARKREHSRKPDELYEIIEKCSPGPYLEMFARGTREGWVAWGYESKEYDITWPTYSNNSQKDTNQYKLKLDIDKRT
jgi:N6-adenosine-specific RNA methylase IME4